MEQEKDIVSDFINLGCCKDEIHNGNISILSVSSTKGLEFDVVYVFTKGMTNNERYIAYTRALSELIIIE